VTRSKKVPHSNPCEQRVVVAEILRKIDPVPSARTTPSLSSVINSEWPTHFSIGKMTIGRRNFLDFESSSRT
jgi:hypothetical protein